jgi:hypothetical protein
MLKILSAKTDAHKSDRGDVLGNARLAADGTGYYACAFRDHIGILEQKLGFAVLGYVYARGWTLVARFEFSCREWNYVPSLERSGAAKNF